MKPFYCRLHSLMFLCGLFLSLSACSRNPNDLFIQGVWITAEDQGEGNPDPVYYEWQFNNGTFYVFQEVRGGSPLASEGSYRILESDGDLLVIELYDISGDRFTYTNNPVDLRIQIDQEKETLYFNRTLFERAGD